MKKGKWDSRRVSALLILLILSLGLGSMLIGSGVDLLKEQGIIASDHGVYHSNEIHWDEIYPPYEKDSSGEPASHEDSTETNSTASSAERRSVFDRFYNLIVKLGNFEKSSEDHFLFRRQFLECSGYINRLLGKTDFGDANGVVQLSNGSLSTLYRWNGYNKNGIQEQSREISSFSNWLSNRGTQFFYVQIPTKIDKFDPEEENRSVNEINEYYDYYDKCLREQGVDILDLRDEIHSSHFSHYDLFFKTDGHWTLQAGKWAAGVIADKMNQDYGTALNSSLLDDSNFEKQVYPKKFLGSLGRKVTLGYIDPDDFPIYVPLFPTDLQVSAPDLALNRRGAFEDVMINRELFDIEDYYKTSIYEAIAYGNRPLFQVRNNNDSQPIRILFIRDSFSLAVIPYFSLLAQSTDWIDVRTTNGNFTGSLKTYIDETNPDLVVLMYDMMDYDIN